MLTVELSAKDTLSAVESLSRLLDLHAHASDLIVLVPLYLLMGRSVQAVWANFRRELEVAVRADRAVEVTASMSLAASQSRRSIEAFLDVLRQHYSGPEMRQQELQELALALREIEKATTALADEVELAWNAPPAEARPFTVVRSTRGERLLALCHKLRIRELDAELGRLDRASFQEEIRRRKENQVHAQEREELMRRIVAAELFHKWDPTPRKELDKLSLAELRQLAAQIEQGGPGSQLVRRIP
jgi:hypothetical protein